MKNKKATKKEWEEKNNIKIAIIGPSKNKMTIKEAIKKLTEESIEKNQNER